MSNLPDTLTYDCPRFGDRYEIELDPSGSFAFATRFVDGIGRDPITYSTLSDIPTPHIQAIERLIWQKKHGK